MEKFDIIQVEKDGEIGFIIIPSQYTEIALALINKNYDKNLTLVIDNICKNFKAKRPGKVFKCYEEDKS